MVDSEPMESMKRTVTCGELRPSHLGHRVILNGWVHRHRDHGGIRFIDLRDRYGITQIVVDLNSNATIAEEASQLKTEYCIAVEGIVRARPKEMINRQRATGEVEVAAEKLSILNRSEIPPFVIDESSDAREDMRFRYRYLDLRSFSMQRNIRLRHDVTLAVREHLSREGFFEIETPTLIRSTPEGARDFLVPSRRQRGKFYALPQSPQLYKQILMVAGFDRYFQIAHCFRDEDSRGDRQIEHTQIDIEMSFVSREDVFSLVEGMLGYVFKKTLNIEIDVPFVRLSFQEAMDRYGTDKPDLRFELQLQNFAPFAEEGEFRLFKEILKAGGTVKALVLPEGASYSRKQIEELEEVAKTYGAKGLAWMKVGGESLEGGISRFFADKEQKLREALNVNPGDLILMVGSDWKTTCLSLGAVRKKLGEERSSSKKSNFHFCWIVDFPLFEWNDEENKWEPAHHMFTMPQERYIPKLDTHPGEVMGDLYDLVCNGVELASGSIRIHDPELQKRIFKIVGLSDEEAERRFGFLIEALRYGAPPHGGIAPGLDRLVMLMAGESTIREVIAFPKNTLGISPMDDTPSRVDASQLKELGLDKLAEQEQG